MNTCSPLLRSPLAILFSASSVSLCATFFHAALHTLLFALLTGPALAASFAGKVVGVHDGDSITVLDAKNTQIKVRLQGIDAPELGQAYGNNAKRELSQQVFGKTVDIRTAGKDRYSMIPWGNRLYFHDETQNKQAVIVAAAGTQEYKDYWGPFLKSFRSHLKEKGWFEMTALASDERKLPEMEAAIALIDSVDPGWKVAVAANHEIATNIMGRVHDISFTYGRGLNRERNQVRAEQGKQTTFYVCMYPGVPNTFTHRGPGENVWMGWHAAAERYSGFLRWALNCYNEDPFKTTAFKKMPDGDCFLMYPGPRSSVRLERLREGFQDFEKVRILREVLTASGESGRGGLEELNRILSVISTKNKDHTVVVNQAKSDLEALTRKVFGKKME